MGKKREEWTSFGSEEYGYGILEGRLVIVPQGWNNGLLIEKNRRLMESAPALLNACVEALGLLTPYAATKELNELEQVITQAVGEEEATKILHT